MLKRVLISVLALVILLPTAGAAYLGATQSTLGSSIRATAPNGDELDQMSRKHPAYPQYQRIQTASRMLRLADIAEREWNGEAQAGDFDVSATVESKFCLFWPIDESGVSLRVNVNDGPRRTRDGSWVWLAPSPTARTLPMPRIQGMHTFMTTLRPADQFSVANGMDILDSKLADANTPRERALHQSH